MKKAIDLLFSSDSSRRALFKSQSDLVFQLLTTPGSAYHITAQESQENLARLQGRLKTYISQLLSDSVVRSVTDDFKRSLKVILAKQIVDYEKLYKDIIEALEAKNAALSTKPDIGVGNANKKSIKEEIQEANYMTVITARPINMDVPINEGGFSIRSYFFQDLILNLLTTPSKIKYYRFNFPQESYGEQFWSGLTKIMFRFLRDNYYNGDIITPLLGKELFLESEISKLYSDSLKERSGTSELHNISKHRDTILKMAVGIINRLYLEKIIAVFIIEQPIFTIPILAINPDESTSSVYAILENDADVNSIYQLKGENMLLWKIFVWYKLKSAKLGKQVAYKPFNV